MSEDDLIWTRDTSNNYYLGRIISPWRYETSIEYSDADFVNIRDCDWFEVGTEDKVPGAIINRFVLGRTVQDIGSNNTAVRSFSITKASEKWPGIYEREALSGNIFDWLQADGCEDVLAIYLQMKRNYYLIPSTCKIDTKTYEFVLIDRETGKSAAAQVKSGKEVLNIDGYAEIATNKIFLFATSGDYHGESDPKVETIDPTILRNFIYENKKLMPEKIRFWVEHIQEC